MLDLVIFCLTLFNTFLIVCLCDDVEKLTQKLNEKGEHK